MSQSSPPPVEHATRGGFPLASLALLMTVLATSLACTDFGRWHQQYTWLLENGSWRLVALFGGVGLFGAIIGVAHIFIVTGKGRARWSAPIAGILAGQIGALILVAPGPIWRTLFAVAVLLATTILLRLNAE